MAFVGDPLRAVEHLLQGGLWDEAAAAIEAAGNSLLACGAHHSVQVIIGGLPEATRVARPRLRYLLGACAWQRWDAAAAAPLLEGAAADFARAGDMVGQGEALVLLSAAMGYAGALERAGAIAERALLLPLAAPARAQLLAGRAWQSIIGGAWPQATADLDEALAIAERSADARTCAALGVALRGSLIGLPGGLGRVARLSRIVAALPTPGDPVIKATAGAMQAWAAIWGDHWAAAVAECQGALALCAPSGAFTNIYAEVYLQQPALAALSGDQELADRQIDRLLAALEPGGVLHGAGRLIALLHVVARLRWLQGRPDELRAAHLRMCSALPSSVWLTDQVLCDEVGALLRLAEGDAESAAAELGAVVREPVATDDRPSWATRACSWPTPTSSSAGPQRPAPPPPRPSPRSGARARRAACAGRARPWPCPSCGSAPRAAPTPPSPPRR